MHPPLPTAGLLPLLFPQSYESDSDDDAPKTQNAKRSNNKAPSLNDSEAFPETLGGGAPVEASAVPNFAGLAASFQGQGSRTHRFAFV